MTQDETIKQVLLNYGQVSRNWCLNNRITRLGAIANRLKKVGLENEGRWVINERGKDYVYYLKRQPEQLSFIK